MAAVGSYLYLAQKDAGRAGIMFEAGDYTACGRFCEQAVEKAFKAYLEVYGGSDVVGLMKLHKPRRLYEKCCELGLQPVDETILATLSDLSEYYYETNYPGDGFFELTRKQAEQAAELMRRMVALVSLALAPA
ncbi:MAG: HEPN domain-containing protein [Defluviitaleaceae bacterium]|nr:HEPN domain-containing protein [Defluviitaleaceae bacterium]